MSGSAKLKAQSQIVPRVSFIVYRVSTYDSRSTIHDQQAPTVHRQFFPEWEILPPFGREIGIQITILYSPKTFINNSNITMKKILALAMLLTLIYSCNRDVTPYQAANNHYTKCKNMK